MKRDINLIIFLLNVILTLETCHFYKIHNSLSKQNQKIEALIHLRDSQLTNTVQAVTER